MDDSLYIRYAVYKMSVLSLSMRDGKSADSAIEEPESAHQGTS